MSDDPPTAVVEPGREDAAGDPSPRAFATTTGLVFQTVGTVYLLMGGGFMLASGRFQAMAGQRIDTVADYFAPVNLLTSLTTLNVLVVVVAGMGLFAFGVGLQAEQRSSGIGAAVTSGVAALTAGVSTVLFLVLGPAWIWAFVSLLLTAAGTVLFLLAGHSASLLKKHPPPPDQNVVDDAWLETHVRRH